MIGGKKRKDFKQISKRRAENRSTRVAANTEMENPKKRRNNNTCASAGARELD